MSLHLPIADDIDAELREFEAAERARLGLPGPRKQWADTMLKPEMARAERGHVTILNSGLTRAQDHFIEGALPGLGYHMKNFGVPTNEGLQVGKEFGNRGQCNPTYFTVGNLVKYLIDLRDKDGKTAAIGTLAPEPGERQIDASGCAIYPSWVNTHHHLFQSLLKGDTAGLNATLTPWLTLSQPFRQEATATLWS